MRAWSLVTSGRREFEVTVPPFVAGIQLKEQLILVKEGLVRLALYTVSTNSTTSDLLCVIGICMQIHIRIGSE